LANPSFAVSVLMLKQITRVGIQTNLVSLYENSCTSQFVCRFYAQGAKRDLTPHWENRESF